MLFRSQSGLDFLARSAVSWQDTNQCYGCHVQAVTLEALSVGQSHQYSVPAPAIRAMKAGLTTLDGGTRSPGGLRYAHGGSLVAASRGFGGASLARYDALVGDDLRDDLLGVAAQLVELQQGDGSVRDPENWVNPPVGTGSPVQLTAQAIATWQEAYERTADEKWLTAVAQAEDWLHGSSPPAATSRP